MTLKFFNTLSRKKEEFVPINKSKVHMYNCGPTVYNYPHIGNYRAYIFADLIKRYLKYKGFSVKQVMNITDVDDKTIRDSQKVGKKLNEFTEVYTKAFFEDLDTLNVDKAEVFPRATETISEMVDIIKKLLEKGYAYKSEDGSIYYSIAKFKNYGDLAKIDKTGMKAGARVKQDEYDKASAQDFALWKSWDESDGDVFWETELGKGRPGWHIECSAMSMKHLGQTLDIHTGGVDNMFPHHENEIAQSEAANGKKFVNYWMHCQYLIVNSEKMSKSLGNFFTLRDLISKGHDPKAIRYQLISTHYRQQLNFTESGLSDTKKTIQKFFDFITKLEEVKGDVDHKEIPNLIKAAKSNFELSMDDDLNISGGLGAIFEFMTQINKVMDNISKKDAKEVIDTMYNFDKVIGVMKKEEEILDKDIDSLISQRQDARKNKDFSLADKIRDDLKEKGIILEDTKDGVRWKRL